MVISEIRYQIINLKVHLPINRIKSKLMKIKI